MASLAHSHARPAVKTVVVTHDYGDVRGGQEKVAVESALGLAAAGLEVAFFCAAPGTDPRLAAAGIRVENLGIPDLKSNPSVLDAARKGIWNFDSARCFRTFLADYDPARTVVHVHGWSKALSSSIGPVVTAPERRHVYTMHEYFLACPNGGFFDYPRQEVCGQRALSLGCIRTNCDHRSYPQKLFRVGRQAVAARFGRLPNGLRHIIYISDLQREVMRPYLPRSATLHRVANPVSIPKAPRVEAEKNRNIVFVGRLEPVKGALDLAAAAAHVDLPVVFVGDGIEAERLRALCPTATITGWVTPDQVYEHIRSARCLAFPSHWYECQPLVPYEALAMGVPVLSYDISAARECVLPGVNGEIVSFANRTRDFPAQLRAYENPSLAERQSRAAYDGYWSDPLTLDRHVDALLAVYAAS